MTRVQLLPEALDDLDDLDGAERKLVFKALKKLETEPEKRGFPLGSELTTFQNPHSLSRINGENICACEQMICAPEQIDGARALGRLGGQEGAFGPCL